MRVDSSILEPIAEPMAMKEINKKPSTLTKAGIDAEISAMGKGQRVLLKDPGEEGVYLRIGERGGKWIVQLRTRGGLKTRVTLGSWPALGIAAAREAARDAKRQAALDINPNEARRAAERAAELERRSRRTLADVLDQYETDKLANLRRGAAVRRALDGKKGLLRDLVGKQPREITREHVADAVRRLAKGSPTGGKGSPISANRSLAYCRAFFNWMASEGIIETSPVGTLKKPSKENTRDRHHSLDELVEIWEAAGTLGYPFGPMYRLAMVLPMRRDEIAAMPVAELDLGPDNDPTQGVWTLPASRTKNGQALRVPLSPLARAIIKDALADEKRPVDGTDDSGRKMPNPYVFSTMGYSPVSGFAKGKKRLDAAIADARGKRAAEAGVDAVEMPHWVLHDLRTSFATMACDHLAVDPAVADRCLNHTASATTSKIMRTYNRSDRFEERRAALNGWAALLERATSDAPSDNVVPLRSAGAA